MNAFPSLILEVPGSNLSSLTGCLDFVFHVLSGKWDINLN